MAVLFRDGFDTYSGAEMGAKWSVINNATVSSAAARNGAQGMAWNSANGGFYAQWNFPANNTNTLYLGFAVYPKGASYGTLCQFYNGTSLQCDVRLNASGQPYITRNGTTLVTATAPISLNAWHYIEFKLLVASSGGIAELRVDGTVVATFTGNTQNVTGGVNNFRLYQGWPTGTNGPWFDDLYLLDSSGSNAWLTTYLGDVKIISGLPNANGTTNNWTPNGAASNYECVNETPWDGDTTYVSDATPGDIDLYTFPAISASAVYDVCVNLVADKDDTALRTIRGEVRSGGVNYDNGVDFTLTQSSYQNFQADFPVDPNTSAQWTVAGVNSAQFGAKETA